MAAWTPRAAQPSDLWPWVHAWQKSVTAGDAAAAAPPERPGSGREQGRASSASSQLVCVCACACAWQSHTAYENDNIRMDGGGNVPIGSMERTSLRCLLPEICCESWFWSGSCCWTGKTTKENLQIRSLCFCLGFVLWRFASVIFIHSRWRFGLFSLL